MIPILQILAVFFGLAMCYLTFVYYKRKNYSTLSFALWIAIWIGFLFMAAFPRFVYGLMQSLQIQRTVDFFVIAGFFGFSVLIFYLYVVTKRNERKVEELVRTLALKRKK